MYFKLKIYNKLNLCINKKVIFFFWYFRILKCVTKRECVTSKVRKDPRGNCKLKLDIHSILCSTKRFHFLLFKIIKFTRTCMRW